MTPLYLPGGFCDVAVWIDGRLLLVVANGAVVTCYLEAAPIWQQLAPESLLFCRGAVHGNLMLTVHQGQSGAAQLVGNGLVRDLGPTFGVQPVGIDGHEAYIVRPDAHPTTYDKIGLVANGYPSPVPVSSQGLSDVQPDGTLWWADLHRTMVIGGTTFTYPNVRGPVTVGQVDGGIAAAVLVEGRSDAADRWRVTLVIPSAGAYEPHVAVSPNGRVAICARTAKGAAYVTTTIQELSA